MKVSASLHRMWPWLNKIQWMMSCMHKSPFLSSTYYDSNSGHPYYCSLVLGYMFLGRWSLSLEVTSSKPRSMQAKTWSNAHRTLLVRALDALSIFPLVLVVESIHSRKPLHSQATQKTTTPQLCSYTFQESCQEKWTLIVFMVLGYVIQKIINSNSFHGFAQEDIMSYR